MFFFIHQKSDYIIYGGIAIFANAGSNILNFIRLRKLINFKKVESYSFSSAYKTDFGFLLLNLLQLQSIQISILSCLVLCNLI